MTFDNYGSYWNVDHCIPISKFDLSDNNQLQLANDWKNLRPSLVKDNEVKSSKIDNELIRK